MEPETRTSRDQEGVEGTCSFFFYPFNILPQDQVQVLQRLGVINESCEVRLNREKHVQYLMNGLQGLSGGYSSLDARYFCFWSGFSNAFSDRILDSRPWLVYWIIHSLDLLDALPNDVTPSIEHTLKAFHSSSGGYGGGPLQLAHCAPTYAAVLSLAILGQESSYKVIDRKLIYRFFMSMKQSEGGFSMHHDGEVDARATYTVIAISSLLNMLTPELIHGVSAWLLKCQTYEGGFGGEPGNEAHGGYAFCAIAALAILRDLEKANIPLLLDWICARQMKVEGGFQGRTNKLVDGCYSLWQGAIPAILSEYLNLKSKDNANGTLMNEEALEKYILLCCQQVEGGLRDKPGKSRDFYHTCYCLSGLSIAQHGKGCNAAPVYGCQKNRLGKTSPVYNIRESKADKIRAYMGNLPNSHDYFLLN